MTGGPMWASAPAEATQEAYAFTGRRGEGAVERSGTSTLGVHRALRNALKKCVRCDGGRTEASAPTEGNKERLRLTGGGDAGPGGGVWGLWTWDGRKNIL